MATYLNADIPPIYCKVRKEYLYDLKEHKGESLECIVFGITSVSGMAILFNIMLTNGACYWRLPISAFFQKSHDRAEVPDMSVDELELWNCFTMHYDLAKSRDSRGMTGMYGMLCKWERDA